MRRNLYIAALLGSTALFTPTPAKALPLLGFIQTIAPALFTSTATFGTAIFGAGASSFFGSIGGRILIGLGLSLISQALAPRMVSPPSENLVNFAQPVSYAEWILGRSRNGGFLGFTGFNDSKRHYSPIVAAHPCEGIVEHYLDERKVEIDAEGLVTTEPMVGYYKIRPFLGAPGQVADAELVSAFSQIDSGYDFAALTGAHVWAKRPPQDVFSEVYPTGRQGSWSPVIDGHNGVYDPRSDTTGFTRNAALLIAFWLTEIIGQAVDWDEVAAQADLSDIVINKLGGATRPKWRIDGRLSDDQEFETQRAQMAAACDAWFYERDDGKVGFKVGGYTEPTITLTETDFLSVQLSEGSAGRNAPTEVAARYVEPEYNWREWSSGPYVIETGTRQVREEPTLYMVSDHNQASWINKRIAKTKRAKYTLKGTTRLMGYFLRGHRFVRVQVLGIDAVFEIGELWRNEGGATFDLVANSVEASDFTLDAATEEPKRPDLQQIAGDNTVPDVTGLTGFSDGRDAIRWVWPPTGSYVTQQLRQRPVGGDDDDWLFYNVPAGQSVFRISGLSPMDYEAQIRNITGSRRQGDWLPLPPATAAALGVAPGSLSVTTSTPEPGRVRFGGVAGTDTAGVRIYRGATTTFADATDVTGVIAASPLVPYEVIAGDAGASNILLNGGFDDASSWTVTQGGWVIAIGKAANTVGGTVGILEQTFTALDVGEDYRAAFTIRDKVGSEFSGVRYRITGSATVDPMSPNVSYGNGSYFSTFTAVSGLTEINMRCAGGFDGAIDDIYLIKQTPECLPQGEAYFWVVPVSSGDVEGAPNGPHLLAVP